jgi:uncharacterized delta-60 repeat protein
MIMFATATAGGGGGGRGAGFGTGGKVVTDFGSKPAYADAVAIRGDGTIVAVGGGYVNDGDAAFALARYSRDGSLDEGFGTGGRVLTGLGPGQVYPAGGAIEPDGKIVAGANHFALARYNPDGSLDRGFGTGGKVVAPVWIDANAIAVQRDGKIVAAGYGGNSPGFALARYNPDGGLDQSFGRGGKVLTDFAGAPGGAYANAAAVERDGRIVVAGEIVGRPYKYGGQQFYGDPKAFALARYTRAGRLDRSFGRGGKVLTRFGPQPAEANAVAIQGDGKIVAAGQGGNGPGFALARYTRDGRLDRSFGRGGKVRTFPSLPEENGFSAVAIQGGKIVAVGGGDDGFLLARYTRAGRLDRSFGRLGKVLTNFAGGASANAVAIQGDGKIVAAGQGGNGPGFALARYTRDGRLDPSFG